MFCNGKMLTNVCDSKQNLTLRCHTCITSVTKKGDLNGHGAVYCHQVLKIFSLNNMKETFSDML